MARRSPVKCRRALRGMERGGNGSVAVNADGACDVAGRDMPMEEGDGMTRPVACRWRLWRGDDLAIANVKRNGGPAIDRNAICAVV